MSLFKPEDMSIGKIIEKLEEAVNLGDSPHRGPFGTHVREVSELLAGNALGKLEVSAGQGSGARR